ncbi:hypothetical protein PVK06_030330 [Gossypium arboreum]|uniref:DUF4005 domain-containing protein n=1 Tax=Gossypium arboreum TaxID=29729 RepID=A0ABR0NN02_GOSAR|nr:hypothetical protein PVK06_030330 [Gossypium arboreum]
MESNGWDVSLFFFRSSTLSFLFLPFFNFFHLLLHPGSHSSLQGTDISRLISLVSRSKASLALKIMYLRLGEAWNHHFAMVAMISIVSIPARKLNFASPRSSVVGPNDDGRSMVSIQSERNRRHSIAGSSMHDNKGQGSSPSLPSYMVPTESTRAKTKLQSPLGLEANETPEKGPIASAKKRLSYPPSPARPRQHLLIQKLVS